MNSYQQNAIIRKANGGINKEIASLQKQLAQIDRAVKGGLSPELIRGPQAECREKIAELRSKLKQEVELPTALKKPRDLQTKIAELQAEMARLKDASAQSHSDRQKDLAQLHAAKGSLNSVRQKIDGFKETLKEITGGVQFSGFFDVTIGAFKTHPNIFALGDFELDMEKGFAKYFQVAAALVFNDDGAELAAGFIDAHLFGGLIPARGRVFMESGLHLQVGRFDLPFGNDWQYFASVDRKTITAPLSTEFAMDGGYNDVGLRILGSYSFFTYTLLALRGVEEGFAFGGRVSFIPFNDPFRMQAQEAQHIEVGFSYLHDISQDGSREERAFAVDLEGRLGPFQLRSEYIRRDSDLDEVRLDGFHVSAFLDLLNIFIDEPSTPIVIYARYDLFRSEKGGDEPAKIGPVHRVTGGASISLFDVALVKAEYAHFVKGVEGNEDFSGGTFIAQLVAVF